MVVGFEDVADVAGRSRALLGIVKISRILSFKRLTKGVDTDDFLLVLCRPLEHVLLLKFRADELRTESKQPYTLWTGDKAPLSHRPHACPKDELCQQSDYIGYDSESTPRRS